MKHRYVTVTEFKAKCLALLDEIGTKGGSITVTKRGRPLATVGPARRHKWGSSENSLAGQLEIDDDVFFKDNSDLFDCIRDPESQM